MKYISNILRGLLIITLFSSIVYGIINSEKPNLTEQTIEVIQKCMESETVSWSDEWKKEYLETIRSVIESHRDVTHFDLRLEILRKA